MRRKEKTGYMVEGVIFDMDGVLIDTEKLYNRFWCEAAIEHGYDMKKEHALMIRSLSAEFAIPRLESVFGRKFDYYNIKKRRIELMNEYVEIHGVQMKKGANILLDYLRNKGIRTGVATSSDMDRTDRYLKMVGLYDKFDVFVCGPEVKRSKPEPDIYITAAQKLGLAPQQCMAVEDSPNGIISAYRAGCMTVMVPDLDEPDEDTRKMLFYKAESLDKIIQIFDFSH